MRTVLSSQHKGKLFEFISYLKSPLTFSPALFYIDYIILAIKYPLFLYLWRELHTCIIYELVLYYELCSLYYGPKLRICKLYALFFNRLNHKSTEIQHNVNFYNYRITGSYYPVCSSETNSQYY